MDSHTRAGVAAAVDVNDDITGDGVGATFTENATSDTIAGAATCCVGGAAPNKDEAEVGGDVATGFGLGWSSSITSSSIEKFAINAPGNPGGAYVHSSALVSYTGAYGSSSSS
ncbi:hypothetical protein PsorP6_009124 [Peronosclerospora sorghi]|uniref:Uncharacterized protein n=1 Tax=Peronosclerospora sorghi TaxID=230839 RepID=A0ACC0VYY6_9STRA|nr:hypothetical protein PsorP6_009124 [Peronosclerospora sorghi]